MGGKIKMILNEVLGTFRRVQAALLTGLMGVVAVAPSLCATLSVTIKDEHGQSVPARVYLTNSNDQTFFAQETIVYDKTSTDGISERHFVPRLGKFSINLPAGKYRLVVERGKEFVPVDITIEIPSSSSIERTIILRRWVDMAARGWFSGDMHLHRKLDDLPALMEAEDLAIAMPITRWQDNRAGEVKHIYEAPDLGQYLAAADEDGFIHLKDGRFFSVLNEELEPHGSALLASALGHEKVELSYPMSRFGKSVQASGGVSDSEKASSLELPALAAVEACQTVGLANNHLWRAGSYALPWGAWPDRMLGSYPLTCSGFVHAGFDMYSALLNMGFPLKLSAGSANGVHPVPPGWSRIYVHSVAPLTPLAWFKRLKEGRSFVTTGPMLFLRVNGKEPGDEVHAERFPMHLSASVEMLSLTPVSDAELVLDGVAHKVILKPEPNKPNAYSGSFEVAITSSTWVVARWSSAMPQGCGAAHTGPIYFWHGSRPIPVNRDEAQLLLNRVNELIRQVGMGDPDGAMVIDSVKLRQETLDYLNEARDIYQRKVRESSSPALGK